MLHNYMRQIFISLNYQLTKKLSIFYEIKFLLKPNNIEQVLGYFCTKFNSHITILNNSKKNLKNLTLHIASIKVIKKSLNSIVLKNKEVIVILKILHTGCLTDR